MKITKITPEEEAQSAFEQWKYHIDTYDINGETITEERLRKWSEGERKLICIFCGSEPTLYKDSEFVICKRCKEFKGIGPDVC